MAAHQQFYYSGQIRRFLIQFIRMMSGFQVQLSKNSLGVAAYQQVPIIYGDSSRQVAQIIRGNSENTLSTVPAMSVYINSLNYDRARMLNPTHVSKIQLQERHYNQDTNEWSESRGDSFMVERLMPAPYKLGLKLDIWTSNTEQKLMLVEQIVTLFNPDCEIQNTDNYVDWTSLSTVFINDTNWTSRNVPMGADDSIDVATITFELPIWLSPPAKVKKLGVIQRVFSDVYDTNGQLVSEITDLSTATLMTRTVITPMNVELIYLGNTLKLLKAKNETGPGSWKELLDQYGKFVSGISQIRLWQDGTQTEAIGTVAYHPTDVTLLLLTPFIDTFPANNLDPINSIIDPLSVTITSTLTSPVTGYRLLILNDIGSTNNAVATGPELWRGTDNTDLVAKENDIIEYNGTHWFVSFSAASASNIKYLTNLTDGVQYKFVTSNWLKSVEGHYGNETWRIVL